MHIRLVLFLMLLLCVFMLYLQGHYSFLVPQQRWFTTCRSGCLCRRMNKSLWEKKNHLHWLPNHLNLSVHSSLITDRIVQFTSLVAQNANALQESLVRAEAYMVCIHVCNSKTNRIYVHGNNTRGQRKNRRRVDRVSLEGTDRWVSHVASCLHTTTPDERGQKQSLIRWVASNVWVSLDWWSSLNLSSRPGDGISD